jgi:hypothetical protein
MSSFTFASETFFTRITSSPFCFNSHPSTASASLNSLAFVFALIVRKLSRRSLSKGEIPNWLHLTLE